MRILIADDQPEVRLALKILLENELGFEIAGEVDNLSMLLKRTGEIQPDMILLDWELSNTGVIETTKQIKQIYSYVKIIALSGRPEAAYTAMNSNVDGFVSKGENSDKVIEEINRIYS